MGTWTASWLLSEEVGSLEDIAFLTTTVFSTSVSYYFSFVIQPNQVSKRSQGFHSVPNLGSSRHSDLRSTLAIAERYRCACT